jgi:hypothetical protein
MDQHYTARARLARNKEYSMGTNDNGTDFWISGPGDDDDGDEE